MQLPSVAGKTFDSANPMWNNSIEFEYK